MKNIKYYLIGVLLFVIAIIGYHFLAASQAEQQIGEALQKFSESEESISITHSDIDIAPFSADVTIRNLSIIMGAHIERAQSINLDLGYFDFLRIYFGGAQHGLENLDSAIITAVNPSYINQSGREELKASLLILTYRGNAYDGLSSAVKGMPFSSSQSLNADVQSPVISLPNTHVNRLKADTIHYSASVLPQQQNFWTEGTHEIRMDSITWTPSQAFQDRYSFFIKGFGYADDAIPFNHFTIESEPATEKQKISLAFALKSELVLVNSSGKVLLQSPMSSSELQDFNIRLTEFSDPFRNVLSNIEQLLSISLQKSDGEIRFQLQGPISNPQLTK